MKIGKLLLLLATPFNRLLGNQPAILPILPLSTNRLPIDDAIDLPQISLDFMAAPQPQSWMNYAYEMMNSPILPGVGAVEIKGRDYKTAIFCGPEIECDYLRKSAKAAKVALMEKKVVSGKKYERLILSAHGNTRAEHYFENNGVMQSDDFAAKFFPNAEIIHALGCSIGRDIKRNFAQNSLKKGQLLFLHAGSDPIISEFDSRGVETLAIKPNEDFFPSPITLNIILKDTESHASFVTLPPLTLEDIRGVAEYEHAKSNDERIGALYDVISAHNQNLLRGVLENFSDDPDIKDKISGELERLGFREFDSEIDQTKKSKMVKEYLNQYFTALMMSKDNSSEQGEALDKMIKLGLVDPNYLVSDRNNISFIATAAQAKKESFVETLASNGADVDVATTASVTPSFYAAQLGDAKSLAIFSEHSADFNIRNNEGETPVSIAASNGYLDCVKILAEGGADLDAKRNDGMTPLMRSIFGGGHKPVIGFLVKKGVEVDSVSDAGLTALILSVGRYMEKTDPREKSKYKDCAMYLIKNGADPHLETKFNSAYQFAASFDQELASEMAQARAKYLQEQPGVQKPKAEQLVSAKEREL